MVQLDEAVIRQICADHRKALEEEPAIIFYLREALDHRLDQLQEYFPANCLHAIAIKTCDQLPVLKHIAERGMGLEAASAEEVQLAVSAGVPNEKIVFDSPVKTRREIEYCHKYLPGLIVNANCLEELERYPPDFTGTLGLRINPLVEADAPKLFNVSRQGSKFGVPISRKEAILRATLQHQQIKGLHMHIGSGVRNFEENLRALAQLKDLADEINTQRTQKGIVQRIEFIDIGGGIEFDTEEDTAYTVRTFTDGLKVIEGLIQNYRLITEYGKFVHKESSCTVSRVEYVTEGKSGLPGTIYLHVGADLFVRKVYSDLEIEYPYFVIHRKAANQVGSGRYNVVGPLCFAGDVLLNNVELPRLEEGDWFVFNHTGANTISMWSKHCSRTPPPFILV